MNRVLLTGRLTRDAEMRAVSNGKNVTHVSLEIRRGDNRAWLAPAVRSRFGSHDCGRGLALVDGGYTLPSSTRASLVRRWEGPMRILGNRGFLAALGIVGILALPGAASASHGRAPAGHGARDFVVGRGNHLANGSGPDVVRTGVVAHIRRNGSVRGRVVSSLKSKTGDTKPIGGPVSCLIVIGNQAFVTWTVKRPNSEIAAGTVIVTHLVDEDAAGGIPGAPDRIRNSFLDFATQVRPPAGQRGPCYLPVLAPVAVVAGNLVVHDR